MTSPDPGLDSPLAEGPRVVAHAGALRPPVDRHHVEAQGRLGEPVAWPRRPARPGRSPALRRGDGFDRRAVRIASALLDLDEDDRPPGPRPRRRSHRHGNGSSGPGSCSPWRRRWSQARSSPASPRWGPAGAPGGDGLNACAASAVPFGVSSSTTPSASRRARAESARANSRRRRASCRSSKRACSSVERRSSRPPGQQHPEHGVHGPSSARTRRRARPGERPFGEQGVRAADQAVDSGQRLRRVEVVRERRVEGPPRLDARLRRLSLRPLPVHLVEPHDEPVEPLERGPGPREPVEAEVQRLAVVGAREQVPDRLRPSGPSPAGRAW